MTGPVVCRSTRYGAGCGHRVGDHVGPDSPNQDCCCCNWQHNTPGHQENCIPCHRRRFAKPGMTAGEFAPHLPEHLRQPYWRGKLEELAAADELAAVSRDLGLYDRTDGTTP